MEVGRRALLGGAALAGAALAASCAPAAVSPSPSATTSASADPSSSPSPSPTGGAGPFGLKSPSTIQVLIHSGAFGTSLIDGAATRLQDRHPGVTVATQAALDIQAVLGPGLDKGAFDLIHNGGTNRVNLSSAHARLADLTTLLDAPSLDDEPIRNSLFSAALRSVTDAGGRRALPYTLIAHGLWYSERAFAKNALMPPTTWAQLVELGQHATTRGGYLFAWDEHNVDDYLELAITAAIKDGGDEVRVALDSLAEDAWSHPCVVGAIDALAQLAADGHLRHEVGATGLWASGSGPLLIPAGARIVRQTVGVRDEEFAPVVAAVPTVSGRPQLASSAIHAGAEDEFLVPATGTNQAGAFELLRTMFSRATASEFSRLNEVPTVVHGSSQGIESVSLRSQARLIAGAGAQSFTWRFVEHYGLGAESNAALSDMLRRKATPEQTRRRLQSLCDKVRNDPNVEHYPVR